MKRRPDRRVDDALLARIEWVYVLHTSVRIPHGAARCPRRAARRCDRSGNRSDGYSVSFTLAFSCRRSPAFAAVPFRGDKAVGFNKQGVVFAMPTFSPGWNAVGNNDAAGRDVHRHSASRPSVAHCCPVVATGTAAFLCAIAYFSFALLSVPLTGTYGFTDSVASGSNIGDARCTRMRFFDTCSGTAAVARCCPLRADTSACDGGLI